MADEKTECQQPDPDAQATPKTRVLSLRVPTSLFEQIDEYANRTQLKPRGARNRAAAELLELGLATASPQLHARSLYPQTDENSPYCPETASFPALEG